MKVQMRRVVQIWGALRQFTGGTEQPELVKGNLGYLPLSFRVATSLKLLEPLMDVYNDTRKPLLEQAKLPPENGEVIPEGQFKVDMRKLATLSEPLLEEEVDMPELKPLTWALLQKAEISIDPAVVMMLGDFLAGEPVEEVGSTE